MLPSMSSFGLGILNTEISEFPHLYDLIYKNEIQISFKIYYKICFNKMFFDFGKFDNLEIY